MKVNTALWGATVALLLTAGWSGKCFAGSGFAGVPKDERAAVAAATQSGRAGADAVAQFADQADAQMDAAGGDGGGNARLEEAEPAPTNKRPGQHSSSKVGIGLKISTLGAGIEAAVPLAAKANLRGGVNIFQYNRALTNDGIHYTGQLHFRSGEAHLDWFPFGGFHVSPGVLFYNGNQLTANASVPGGRTFTLSGTTYESDPAMPLMGTGKLDFVKVSPSIMLGFGNLIPRSGRHYSFLFEIGGAYQGSARVALNFTGNVCDTSGINCRSVASDPTVQANVQAQQQKIRNDINPYRFFPVVSLGVGFNF
jgi:hypothetical protein